MMHTLTKYNVRHYNRSELRSFWQRFGFHPCTAVASSENPCLKAFIYHMKYQHLKKPKCLLIIFVRYLKCVTFQLHRSSNCKCWCFQVGNKRYGISILLATSRLILHFSWDIQNRLTAFNRLKHFHPGWKSGKQYFRIWIEDCVLNIRIKLSLE